MKDKVNWFSISMLLAGIVLGGGAGIIRGDWLGRDAAAATEKRLSERADREMAEIRADLSYLRSRVDELIARIAAREGR